MTDTHTTSLEDMPFDPDEFMQQTVDAPMETDFQLCPEGHFQAMIDDFDSKALFHWAGTYQKGPRAGQSGSMTTFTCPWSIQDPKVLADLGRDKIIATQKVIVDRTPQGGIDFGKDKNVELGRIRAAVGQNTPGTWGIMNLRGAGPALVQVKHEEYLRKDGTKGKAARVVRVAKIV